MDAAQVAILRELLQPTGLLDATEEFGRALRASVHHPGGLLLVGTPSDEPWHLAAHLDDESRLSRLPELSPILVRWAPPPGAPAHLSVGMTRLSTTRRGESLLVVAPQRAPVPLLERLDDARANGARILALDQGDADLESLAHESLTVSPGPLSFDGAQHLVSSVAGALSGRGGGLRDRLARLLEVISGPPQR